MKDKIFWLLLIFAAVYILGNIATGSLSTWDEAVYANISGSILKTGDWLIMHERTGPWFDKPPLYMWATAILYNSIGINEFTTRFTSSIFGIATVLILYIFIKRNYSLNTAMLAALLLLASPHYIHFAKSGMLDVTLTFFISLMVFFFWEGQKRPILLFWSGTALLFAYLAKGMATISGPVVILLYCLLSANMKLLVRREFIAGIALSVILIFAWHLIQYVYGGQESINSYFGFHIFKRAATSVEGHTGGLNFYQKVIFNKNKPWGIIYYPAFGYAVWLAARHKDKRAILLTAWTVSVFTICTIVKTKLHWYIVPIYPALAAISAIFLDRFLKKRIFYSAVALILFAMIIQAPVSWAFKLDLNAKAKDAALHSARLPYEDNGTIFYYETVKLKRR